jgi:hypothetical protein
MMARAKAKAEAEAKARAAADPRLAKAKADAEAKAAEAKAKAEAKAAELDAKHGISSKAEAKAAEAKKAADIKMHGKVAELFYEFDADASGYLDGEPASTTWWTPAAGATPEHLCSLADCARRRARLALPTKRTELTTVLRLLILSRAEAEVIEFCGTLGLKFTAEEGCQALDEMEMDDSRDGQVTIEECGAHILYRVVPAYACAMQSGASRHVAAELIRGGCLSVSLCVCVVRQVRRLVEQRHRHEEEGKHRWAAGRGARQGVHG